MRAREIGLGSLEPKIWPWTARRSSPSRPLSSSVCVECILEIRTQQERAGCSPALCSLAVIADGPGCASRLLLAQLLLRYSSHGSCGMLLDRKLNLATQFQAAAKSRVSSRPQTHSSLFLLAGSIALMACPLGKMEKQQQSTSLSQVDALSFLLAHSVAVALTRHAPPNRPSARRPLRRALRSSPQPCQYAECIKSSLCIEHQHILAGRAGGGPKSGFSRLRPPPLSAHAIKPPA